MDNTSKIELYQDEELYERGDCNQFRQWLMRPNYQLYVEDHQAAPFEQWDPTMGEIIKKPSILSPKDPIVWKRKKQQVDYLYEHNKDKYLEMIEQLGAKTIFVSANGEVVGLLENRVDRQNAIIELTQALEIETREVIIPIGLPARVSSIDELYESYAQ